MQKYHDVVLDNQGNAILGTTITVTDNPGGGVSTIYSDDGVTALANPFTASLVDGSFSFYAANGRYDVAITKSGFTTESLTDITLNDHADSISSVDIGGGIINNTVIGGITRAAGSFTAFTSIGIDDNATSTAITIDSSENVGIGNSSLESWQSAWTALQINATGVISADGTSLILGENFYNDGAHKYISTSEAARYVTFSGKHKFDVAASGTADTAITWTTALTIDNDGDVGIGIAAPDGTLHVHTASAGSVTASTNCDDLVIETSGTGGLSILTSDMDRGRLMFGSPSLNNYGEIRGFYNAGSSLLSVFINDAETIQLATTIRIKEVSAAVADQNGYGQLWVKTATPNQLWFTDDAGTDTQIV